MSETIALGLRAFITTSALIIGIALLPNGADYPYPTEATTAITTAYTYLYSLNLILPVDTLVLTSFYGITIMIVTRLVWPAVFWLFKTVTGGGE